MSREYVSMAFKLHNHECCLETTAGCRVVSGLFMIGGDRRPAGLGLSWPASSASWPGQDAKPAAKKQAAGPA